MKNEKDLGKEAKPEIREAIARAATNIGSIGGCPKCGDYMFKKGDEAVCCYCEYSEKLEDWNKRD